MIIKKQKMNIFKLCLFCLLATSLVVATKTIADHKFIFSSGDSMNPTISDGMILIVKSTHNPTEKLDGLIITYNSPIFNTSICHRVVIDYEDTLITKGDNNRLSDPEILRSDITGIVVSVIPNWALFLMIFFLVSGFTVLLALVCTTTKFIY